MSMVLVSRPQTRCKLLHGFIYYPSLKQGVLLRFINNELNLRHVNVYGFDYDVSCQGHGIGLYRLINCIMHSTPLPIIPTTSQEQSMIY